MILTATDSPSSRESRAKVRDANDSRPNARLLIYDDVYHGEWCKVPDGLRGWRTGRKMSPETPISVVEARNQSG